MQTALNEILFEMTSADGVDVPSLSIEWPLNYPMCWISGCKCLRFVYGHERLEVKCMKGSSELVCANGKVGETYPTRIRTQARP
jgi:hypothetical protein